MSKVTLEESLSNLRWKLQQKPAVMVHISSHSGVNEFKWFDCDKQFGSQRSLKHHRVLVHFHNGSSCNMCDNTFELKEHLQRHIIALMMHNTVKLNSTLSPKEIVIFAQQNEAVVYSVMRQPLGVDADEHPVKEQVKYRKVL
jgi:hypothetical protein